MNTNLVIYDLDEFLNKYTRFMTKDIYISKTMYDNFLKSYNYLYEKLEMDAILYRENSKYKKIFEIKNNKDKLLKLHNQKYLKKNIGNYNKLFNSLNLNRELDTNQKSIILSNEDKMIYVSDKNILSLIVAKVKYLIDVLKIKENRILVLVDDDVTLKDLFNSNDLDRVKLISVREYNNKLLKDRILINNNDKYELLLDYIMNILFSNKDKFNRLYKAFSNNIYLNKDYLDYDTFSDYHNYMYKRKFLSSKLSLDKFVDKEISKKVKYLRTIKNELVQSVEEVEIANYLCFNSILYRYDKNNNLFILSNDDKEIKLKINNTKMIWDKDIIYIDLDKINDNTYKEELDKEFKLRGIKNSNLDYKDIYNILKNSMIDNYFSEFVNKYLIKYLDYYDLNRNFNDTKLNKEQIQVLVDIYNYYREYLENNNLVTNKDISLMLENSINSNNYKYIIINSNINLKLNGSILKIINDYREVELIKENIKLLYDYKKYLNDNKVLVGTNAYIDEEEISQLTTMFLKENLSIINDSLVNNEKKISIYLYDDSNRLLVNKNISRVSYSVIRKNDDILIGINNINNTNVLVYRDFFVKVDKKRLAINNDKIIECEDVLSIKKSYDKIILPFLITNLYNEDLIAKNSNYTFKLMIYVSLSKCKSELILLCPNSKKKEIMKILSKIKNISVFE